MFKFNRACCNDPYIEVDFKRELEGGWYLALLLGTKVYLNMSPFILPFMLLTVVAAFILDKGECY